MNKNPVYGGRDPKADIAILKAIKVGVDEIANTARQLLILGQGHKPSETAQRNDSGPNRG